MDSLGGVSPNFPSSLHVGGFGPSTQKQYDFAGDIPGQQQDRSLGSGGSGGVRIWQWSGDWWIAHSDVSHFRILSSVWCFRALLSDNASC